jgi:hypothetical protein
MPPIYFTNNSIDETSAFWAKVFRSETSFLPKPRCSRTMTTSSRGTKLPRQITYRADLDLSVLPAKLPSKELFKIRIRYWSPTLVHRHEHGRETTVYISQDGITCTQRRIEAPRDDLRQRRQNNGAVLAHQKCIAR